MNLPNDNSNLFCLEGVENIEENLDSKIFSMLEHITTKYGITNVYQCCDSIEGFENSLETLLYEDRNFKDYEIIYLVFSGNENLIEINNYFYSLEEIAELFEGKLTGKILHFANTKTLDLDEETAQYFLDVTGAKAISGYGKTFPLLSTVLDAIFFGIYQENDDLIEMVELLFEKHTILCQTMDFRLYY